MSNPTNPLPPYAVPIPKALRDSVDTATVVREGALWFLVLKTDGEVVFSVELDHPGNALDLLPMISFYDLD